MENNERRTVYVIVLYEWQGGCCENLGPPTQVTSHKDWARAWCDRENRKDPSPDYFDYIELLLDDPEAFPEALSLKEGNQL